MIETEAKKVVPSPDSRNGSGELDGRENGDADGSAELGERGKGNGGGEAQSRRAGKRVLIASLALVSIYAVAQFVGGALSGSLALKADAGHMMVDIGAIVLALLAMWFSDREASAARTFGNYRTEALAALISAFALWLVAAWIFFEGYHRIWAPIDINGEIALVVAVMGLSVNVVMALTLHRTEGRSLNVESSRQHVIADLLGSVGAVASAILIIAFDLTIMDPIIGIGIGVLILISSWQLVAKVFHVLMEGTPKHIDVYKLCADIEDMDGVTLVHDVHIWTITPGNEAFTAHALIDPSREGDDTALLKRIQEMTHNKYGISHVTIQVERSLEGCTENHHVGHLYSRSVNGR